MTVPYTFATDTGTIPLADLDANFSSVANNVSTANTVVSSAQPNITSVGTLTALTVTGAVAGSQFVGSGSTLYNIQGANVSGAVATATNSTQANYANTANAVVGSNVSGIVAQASQASYANTANTANAVAGSNVSGVVAQATQANYANVATYANTANAVAGSNVSGQVANAAIAGTVYTAAQPNITSVGLLTSVSSSGNIITTANVNGGNVNSSGIVSATGNITGANLNVGSGNVNVGNVVFALDNSKFNSAKWTLVESFANLNFTPSSSVQVTMTNSIGYYKSNYNELVITYYGTPFGPGGQIQTTLPTPAISVPGLFVIGVAAGAAGAPFTIQWSNINSGNTTIRSGTGGDTAYVGIYAR